VEGKIWSVKIKFEKFSMGKILPPSLKMKGVKILSQRFGKNVNPE
jgi:hypothetical protein